MGTHDFVAFAATNHTSHTTTREILSVDFKLEPLSSNELDSGHMLTLTFHGRGFLKQMIRNIVGTLVEIGYGKRSPASLSELLKKPGAREEAGHCAPAEGLFLTKVGYDQIQHNS